MPSETDLIPVLQKLYAGEAQLHIASCDDGWKMELGQEGQRSFARRKFTPDDIVELPRWIETEAAKPRSAAIVEPEPWPRVRHLRVVK
jgi:hypothetical protein